MRSGLQWLAFASLVSARLDIRRVVHDAQRPAPFKKADTGNESPCGILSEAFEAANKVQNEATAIAVVPSIAIACLKSVPVDKERDLALLSYIWPFVSMQSTIEVLAHPPEEYLVPGVDLIGGFDRIGQKLAADGYASQYDVMTDLRSLFATAADGHFGYDPALLNTMIFSRTELNFTAVSWDGIETPHIIHARDVDNANNGRMGYRASTVKDVDGIPIHEFIERDAVENVYNFQDPDAQWNNQFSNIPANAAGKYGASVVHNFDIPDNYTIHFWNDSYLTAENYVLVLPGFDFSGIDSGEKFHEAFEIPSQKGSKVKARIDAAAEDLTPRAQLTQLPGYPKPEIIHSMGSIAGYFLNTKGFENVAILSILSFEPLGPPVTSDEALGDFLLEGSDVIAEFYEGARKAGKDKLIIDLSTNGGGLVELAQQAYRLTFPKGTFNAFDRYRASGAMEAVAIANYTTLLGTLIETNNPIGTDGRPITSGAAFYGPETVQGEKVTTAFQSDKTEPFAKAKEDAYLNGFEPNGQPRLAEQLFEAENILVITDGTCASACNILTGLLTRAQGVRTLALGGRAIEAPMQAMGGVKGTLINKNNDILQGYEEFVSVVGNIREDDNVLNKFRTSLPSLDPAPLLPLIDANGGGSVNSVSSYVDDDLNGFPVQLKYEAANCRLFYTQRMFGDITEVWRRAAGVAWGGEKCARGSTTNSDGTMGAKTLPFNANVKSRVPGVPGPGALS